MTAPDVRARFETLGAVPVRIHAPATSEPGPAVLLLHGLGASSGAHGKELDSLARAGFTAFGPDAPHHGARRGPWLDEVEHASGARAHEAIVRMIAAAVDEVPTLLDAIQARGYGPVGVAGISMGAFIALGAFAREPRLTTAVSILGSPDWNPGGVAPTPEAERLLAGAPVRHAAAFGNRPLLLMNAGRDPHVPPAPMRAFAQALRAHYDAAHADRLQYREYPESGHFMRGEDWDDLWANTLRWLGRHVAEAGTSAYPLG